MSNDPGWDGYLKAAMASAEVDAAELGRRSGVNETQISRWRRGIGQPSLDSQRMRLLLGRVEGRRLTYRPLVQDS